VRSQLYSAGVSAKSLVQTLHGRTTRGLARKNPGPGGTSGSDFA
jgi:hypothetical protein